MFRRKKSAEKATAKSNAAGKSPSRSKQAPIEPEPHTRSIAAMRQSRKQVAAAVAPVSPPNNKHKKRSRANPASTDASVASGRKSVQSGSSSGTSSTSPSSFRSTTSGKNVSWYPFYIEKFNEAPLDYYADSSKEELWWSQEHMDQNAAFCMHEQQVHVCTETGKDRYYHSKEDIVPSEGPVDLDAPLVLRWYPGYVAGAIQTPHDFFVGLDIDDLWVSDDRVQQKIFRLNRKGKNKFAMALEIDHDKSWGLTKKFVFTGDKPKPDHIQWYPGDVVGEFNAKQPATFHDDEVWWSRESIQSFMSRELEQTGSLRFHNMSCSDPLGSRAFKKYPLQENHESPTSVMALGVQEHKEMAAKMRHTPPEMGALKRGGLCMVPEDSMSSGSTHSRSTRSEVSAKLQAQIDDAYRAFEDDRSKSSVSTQSRPHLDIIQEVPRQSYYNDKRQLSKLEGEILSLQSELASSTGETIDRRIINRSVSASQSVSRDPDGELWDHRHIRHQDTPRVSRRNSHSDMPVYHERQPDSRRPFGEFEGRLTRGFEQPPYERYPPSVSNDTFDNMGPVRSAPREAVHWQADDVMYREEMEEMIARRIKEAELKGVERGVRRRHSSPYHEEVREFQSGVDETRSYSSHGRSTFEKLGGEIQEQRLYRDSRSQFENFNPYESPMPSRFPSESRSVSSQYSLPSRYGVDSTASYHTEGSRGLYQQPRRMVPMQADQYLEVPSSPLRSPSRHSHQPAFNNVPSPFVRRQRSYGEGSSPRGYHQKRVEYRR